MTIREGPTRRPDVEDWKTPEHLNAGTPLAPVCPECREPVGEEPVTGCKINGGLGFLVRCGVCFAPISAAKILYVGEDEAKRLRSNLLLLRRLRDEHSGFQPPESSV